MIAARQGIIAKQSNFVNIILRSSQGPTESELFGYSVFYSTTLCTGWGAWPAITNCPNIKDCEQYGTLTIPANTIVYIAVKECSGTFIAYNAADDYKTDECPGNLDTYCYNYDSCTGTEFSFNSGTVNKNIAINTFVGKDGNYVSCMEAPEEVAEE
jgi:hypothetical protein